MEEWLRKHMWPALPDHQHHPSYDILLAEPWVQFLDMTPFFRQKLYNTLSKINEMRKSCIIYPPQAEIMSWSYLCAPEDVKVVIIGQDPYHGGQANGQAFSVNKGFPVPPSLQNIFKEVRSCYPDFVSPGHGCLEEWGRQGVLLLNTILTVEAKKPGSHSDLGWTWFTNLIISTLSNKLNNCVFMLWGSKAIAKSLMINKQRHLVLKAQHPSPLAAKNNYSSSQCKFLGCGHFLTANKYLTQHNKVPIDWTLE
ncbi:uracil-DNA glycosylase [Alcelaphine gammaherpesvirus 1]|uniref:Uracil-DNA glycosylase n=1 Tax=Alcelaphine herpesvirus 1 (strain C500) TaxID=654901 RepID=UNG_ALHV1|nr:uracil-DNA glycosylase [Alcelaphine gammaherpesvirus 1]O36395.1 RecName: Full=Uracil-DNA glycosylase; Short=UDG; AltName: Full=UNG [Alcelaphine herpesvirus 1 strain C500]AAC58092.1 uracil-DNA glycosylase [Alcelaphine gammaherpesvirus 1]APB09470.1 uracil-DNA glycosylase [Alcelaphine gammaherpesvirus 1]APB09542.1 uracil-DNA glycosylase [Alcelaphine gammaherpesvirus 1]ATI21933.1 ORF46 [Alcelaphine gammaherpesvirus 1]QDY92279.1 uracil-DNA glycosylase [Alcelaphine gammaherpesvirus 1]